MQRIDALLQRAYWPSACAARHTTPMNTKILILAGTLMLSAMAQSDTPAEIQGPRYAGDKMRLPENYREWIYLSSGFDMSYNALAVPGHHMFDNVFVEPGAYRAFLNTGTWPDKTVFVLEARGAEGKGSINQHGNYQGMDVMGREVHVKDTARFKGGWAFFSFEGVKEADMIPMKEDCYSCHLSHAAVDTTFVQFYPTLLPLAQAKGTLSPNYKP
jgi:hypothetical protein